MVSVDKEGTQNMELNIQRFLYIEYCLHDKTWAYNMQDKTG